MSIDARPVIRRAVADLLNGVPPAIVSARFHLSVARLIVAVAENVRSERQLNRVVLSGGVFQNLFLLERTCEMLRAKVFRSSRTPGFRRMMAASRWVRRRSPMRESSQGGSSRCV